METKRLDVTLAQAEGTVTARFAWVGSGGECER
jgi:hypothetical protein